MKPHKPNLIKLTQHVSALKGILGVNSVLIEMDQETENIKMTLMGDSIPFEKVRKVLEEHGATIHSIDMVATGERVIDEVATPQD
jgi:hypothetical protein